jgi:hypothetical protein
MKAGVVLDDHEGRPIEARDLSRDAAQAAVFVVTAPDRLVVACLLVGVALAQRQDVLRKGHPLEHRREPLFEDLLAGVRLRTARTRFRMGAGGVSYNGEQP